MTGISFDQLTTEQQVVADHTARTVLVLGGAGVGKTTTALWAARRELTEHGCTPRLVPGRRVLFVTFSRTAVAQIRSRAGGVLTGISEAVEILTFHGLAYRLVRDFGRYAGHDKLPTILGEARLKLGVAGPDARQALTYDDLLPLALAIIETPGPIADLMKTRWSLIICDEFQDTDNDEWRILQRLATQSRLLLLADPNQMIYGFKDGVDTRRLDAARSGPDVAEITLPPGSHRDPTQVIPHAAAEVRWRRFDSEPVQRAVQAGRLTVYTDVPGGDEQRAPLIADHVAHLRAEGHVTIGIYAKTNNDAARLSAALTESGVDHAPIGFGEAYGESLSAMVTMMSFSQGLVPWEKVGSALGVTLTASVRSREPPTLATALSQGTGLPTALQRRLTTLRADLEEARDDLIRLAELSARAWEVLSIASGRRAWSRAGRRLVSLAARYSACTSEAVERLAVSVAELRNESFVELDSGDTGAIQLMNFHQTKGREADAVILSYTSADYYGLGGEPYDEPSRVLYVSMTRARRKIIILLPPSPHALVRPFAHYATEIGAQTDARP